MSSRSDPFTEIERLFDRLSRQFEEASREWTREDKLGTWPLATSSMAVDLVEHDDEFVATVDLPGFEREDVDVRVTDHTLRIEAERESSEETEEENYLRRERSHRALERSIRLPTEVDTDAVDATMTNGVLTISLPKLETEEARRIEIE